MQTVKCFKRDHWCDIDVFEMKEGDIFAQGGQTYVTTGKAFIDENGKTNVPADLYDSGPIRIAVGIKGQDFIHMAMDFVGSPAHDFGDGTMQICDLEDGNTNIYSPRLPIAKLNAFCKEHIDKYEEFFEKHEHDLDRGISIKMARFW